MSHFSSSALRFSVLTVGVALGLLGAACREARLEPARDVDQLDVGMSFVEQSGIRLAAQPGAWEGSARVAQKLTPIYVEIVNESGRTITFNHSDLELVGAGRTLLALAPAAIDIEPQRTTLGMDPSQPDPQVSLHGSLRQPDYQKEVLHGEILDMALPEGPLETGMRRMGFAYFEPLPGNLERADLRFTARWLDGDSVALSLPFAVR